MAEMNVPVTNNRNKSGVKKPVRKTLRVDLTAMVDVCFLLIMFFIFTSQMEGLKAMHLIVPKDVNQPDDSIRVSDKGALTLLLKGQEDIYYYEGIFQPGIPPSKTSIAGLREILTLKKQRTPEDELMVIIKPAASSNYKTTVDVLDEMTITDIKSYALTDISAVESAILPGQ